MQLESIQLLIAEQIDLMYLKLLAAKAQYVEENTAPGKTDFILYLELSGRCENQIYFLGRVYVQNCCWRRQRKYHLTKQAIFSPDFVESRIVVCIRVQAFWNYKPRKQVPLIVLDQITDFRGSLQLLKYTISDLNFKGAVRGTPVDDLHLFCQQVS